MCGIEFDVWTNSEGVNEAAVIGTIVTGTGFFQLEQLLAAMNVPCMDAKTYRKYHEQVNTFFQQAALEDMEKNIEAEKKLAIMRGDVTEDGIPKIPVICDGTWSKRSYGRNYDALSGVAFIIGYHRNKVLYFGVKNKYCCICDRAEKKNHTPKDHKCYKNFDRDKCSSSMEKEIIAEGFATSLDDGIIYSVLIADGDSSVYNAILDLNPYEKYGIIVQKIECTKHLLRNYIRKLLEAAKSPGRGFAHLRTLVYENILNIRQSIISAIGRRRIEDLEDSTRVDKLREDISNIPHHIFGDHSKCGNECEKKIQEGETNYVPALTQRGIFLGITGATNYLGLHLNSLIKKLTSNSVKSCNSIVCKFVGGKRCFYSFKESYLTRCAGSVVQYNNQRVLSSLNQTMGKETTQLISSLEDRRIAGVKRTQEHRKRKADLRESKELPQRRKKQGTNEDYGKNCNKPDLNEEDFEKAKKKHFQELEENQKNRDDISKMTVDQSCNPLWMQLRCKMISASRFGIICKRLETTECKNIVKNIVRPKVINSVACRYGMVNEKSALKQLEQERNVVIEKNGLMIDKEFCYLGATPDGLIGKDGIVEIKCPYSARDYTPFEAIKNVKAVKEIFTESGDSMNTNHNYYYQVQGQLHVTDRQYCLFVLWTSKGMKVLRIERDDDFWRKKMKPKLTRFYLQCILPEIVDSRLARKMEIREPAYIIEAKNAADKKRNHSLKRRKNKVYDDKASTEQQKKLEYIETNVINTTSWLSTDSFDEFLSNALIEFPAYDFLSTMSVQTPKTIKAVLNDTDIQAVGINSHWFSWCYKNNELHLFDSMHGITKDAFKKLPIRVQTYIRNRYPDLDTENVYYKNVTQQPDCASCGIYTAAFISALLLNKDPAEQSFLQNPDSMRQHLMTIIRSRKISSFPKSNVTILQEQYNDEMRGELEDLQE